MTTAGVAAHAAEQRHNLTLEIHRPAGAEAAHTDGDLALAAAVLDADARCAIAGRRDISLVIDVGDGGITALVVSCARNILFAVGNEQLPAGKGVLEVDGLGGAGQFSGRD